MGWLTACRKCAFYVFYLTRLQMNSMGWQWMNRTKLMLFTASSLAAAYLIG